MMLLAIRDPTVHISRLVICLFSCMFFAVVYIKSRERTQDQVLNRLWLIIWHMGVPSQMCLAACLGQNLDLESEIGTLTLSSPCCWCMPCSCSLLSAWPSCM